MSQPTAVFDLDGTLVDTALDLLDSLNHCLAAADMAPAAPREVGRFVGNGSRIMIERAFAAHGRPLASERLDQLVALFLQHYGEHIPGKSRPYPGAVAALDRLIEAGYRVAVCTNKFEAHSISLLDALGLSSRLSAVCGRDTFAFCKPDPRHLTATIAKAGGDPDRALMVGDSRTDIDTARAAGVPVVAVDFGYTDRPVTEYGPSRVISHFDELSVALADDLLAAAQIGGSA